MAHIRIILPNLEPEGMLSLCVAIKWSTQPKFPAPRLSCVRQDCRLAPTEAAGLTASLLLQTGLQ